MFNIHHIVASFPIYKSSAFKVGVMPYSSVGYKFSHHEDDDQIIASIGDILYQQSGQGSLYQVFAGAGVTFFKRLSVGGDAIFYIGSIDRYSNVDFTTNTYYRSYIRGWEYVPRGWSGKFGLQYEQPLGKDLSLTLGVTYKLASQLKGYATSYTYAESTSYTDTLASYLDLPAAYSIPSEKGIGLSLRKNEKWMVEFDYLRQDWKKTIFDPTPGIDFATGNSETFNLGFEIIPNKYDIRYFMKRVTYRVGAYHSKTYMILNGQQLCNTGITLGFSVPVFNRNTSIAFSVDLGQYGPFDKASMKERYFKFNLGLNLSDTWFHKSLYN
ncbi:MAG: hypothetical protein HUJ90_06140, partial [Bacteroidales bacterium]|nr:hypothetical protein [Bacteroidales bacterium]